MEIILILLNNTGFKLASACWEWSRLTSPSFSNELGPAIDKTSNFQKRRVVVLYIIFKEFFSVMLEKIFGSCLQGGLQNFQRPFLYCFLLLVDSIFVRIWVFTLHLLKLVRYLTWDFYHIFLSSPNFLNGKERHFRYQTSDL